MPNYMLFLHQDADRPKPASKDDMMAITKAYMDWAGKMHAEGRMKGGEKLSDDVGKVLRPKNGKITVTDGPYVESKEVVGGYFTISAKDMAEACKVAETCPHLTFGGRIEIKKIDEMR